VRNTLRSAPGFTLIETVVALMLFATLAAISVPLWKDFDDAIALSRSERLVQTELQRARMGAVTTNHILRVRFNCPAAGQFRTVELIGTPTVPAAQDTAADRCSSTVYPFPPADNNAVTLPNLDGPVVRIDSKTTFTASQTIEFRPTGIAYTVNANGTSGTMIAGDAAITVTKGNKTKTVTVNALGKISAQ
jgi:prepilin-type N-terminal cleavage/methylation domain-containing protein